MVGMVDCGYCHWHVCVSRGGIDGVKVITAICDRASIFRRGCAVLIYELIALIISCDLMLLLAYNTDLKSNKAHR